MDFNVIACQVIKGKNGKTYYRPSVVLPNGAVHTFFCSKAFKQGDKLSVTIRQRFLDGQQFLVLVPVEE